MPVEMSGARERKKVQRFSEVMTPKTPKDEHITIPKGKGESFGEIFSINQALTKGVPETLKILHRVCFNRVGKATMLRRNLRQFNGFDFGDKSDAHEKKLEQIKK